MLEFTLSNDDFGLVRMGRKRSIVRLFIAPTFAAAQPVRILHAVGPMKIEATLVRSTVTTIGELTQEDAVKAGYLNLPQLQQELMEKPHITLDVPVSIFEFRREGEE